MSGKLQKAHFQDTFAVLVELYFSKYLTYNYNLFTIGSKNAVQKILTLFK